MTLGPGDAVTVLRLRLREAGYHPIPAEGKAPPMKGWQDKFDTTPEEIRLWQRSWHMARNTGVLAKFAPGLDIDLLEEAACEAIEALINTIVSDGDTRVLVRVGQAPKRLIPFRTATPFRKLILNAIAPNGTAGRVEFLGDGQHYVCDGIHPATHMPYVWHGANCLADVPHAELPLIRDAQHAQEILDKIGAMLVAEHGYRLDRPKAKAGNGRDQGHGGADIARLVDDILNGRNLHDSLRDYAMSLIGSGASKRQATATLHALMDAAQIPHDARWKERRDEIPGLVASAAAQRQARAAAAAAASDVKIEDFVAYMPAHNYIFKPTREMWPAGAVNARVPQVLVPGQKPLLPAAWLDANAPVEQMTWVPGKPMLVKDRLIADGGWIERKGCTVFNLYRPPALAPKAGDAAPWLNHVSNVYPAAAEHIVAWLAHRVQHPDDKINHALVLGGKQGIGKDTLLEPIKHAVGPWNFVDVTPRHMLGRFNGYAKAVILRVSEARDLGDVDRYAFYDHMKLYTAAPPDVLRVDEKNLREYTVFNICGVIITSNHKADGIFLPADDRRHFVAWSALSTEDFGTDYWAQLYRYYVTGGNEAVAEYLATFDLSDFDPKAPPPKTAAFWEIVDAGRATEDGELADVLDRLGNPDATTLVRVQNEASDDFKTWLLDRKHRRQIPHRFEQCGYVPVRNPSRDTGLWVIYGARQVVYAKASLSLRDRLAAAERLAT